ARAWEPRLTGLPRPFIAVLVGGCAGPFALDRAKAERLGREASAMARKQGGSLLLTTSGRTSRAATEGLRTSIDVPHRLFQWRPMARENPYFAFLALADSIVVTCDSASMLAEACATRRPVYLFDLARDDSAVDTPPPLRSAGRRLVAWGRRCNPDRLRAFLYRQVLVRLGSIARARDSEAVWRGQPLPHRPLPPPLDEMPRTLARVRALLAQPRQGRVAASRAGSIS